MHDQGCTSSMITMTTLALSPYSIAAFFIILIGYLIQTSFLQYYFFYYNGGRGSTSSNCSNISRDMLLDWKIRKDCSNNCGTIAAVWWLPLLKLKPGRTHLHAVFASINLLHASCFALVITELSIRGHTHMRFDSLPVYGISSVLIDFAGRFIFPGLFIT